MYKIYNVENVDTCKTNSMIKIVFTRINKLLVRSSHNIFSSEQIGKDRI